LNTSKKGAAFYVKVGKDTVFLRVQ